MTRGYQMEFSRIRPGGVLNVESRIRKAETTLAVLREHLGSTGRLCLLDIGCSSGVITNHLSTHFRFAVGIDIDESALRRAARDRTKPNLEFMLGDSTHTAFRDGSFDVVVCTQVYEHVPDADQAMSEIFRVLKPGGVCYFAAGNRLILMEPHYRLPFLSVIPRPAANLYMRISKKGDKYYERFRTYWGLKRLVRRFDLTDYTVKIVNAPGRYHATDMLKENSLKQALSRTLLKFMYWLSPGYIWILRKPLTCGDSHSSSTPQ
jgi:2-polyprenyl-3-methyl-5-hydroxy-6-metoxy-1,4-benzoquinol methylase